MNYQQAFSHVTVLLPIDPGKLKHRKTRVVLYVAPTSIATPPWIGSCHPVIHLGEETKWSGVSLQQSVGNARTQT